jgi:hypothetical protein
MLKHSNNLENNQKIYQVVPHRMTTAGNDLRAHGARAKAGA